MASRISENHKKRLIHLQSEFGVRVERSINGFKVIGLGNNTEPRALDLESTISIAERECNRIYSKYL